MLPTPRSPRYKLLDAWRGLACLMVVVYHSAMIAAERVPFSWSNPATWIIDVAERLWIGVPIFFVISGYCIAATADNTRRKSGRRMRTFFWRRAKRIFPPYWAALLFLCGVILFMDAFAPSGFLDDAHPPIPRPWSLAWPEFLGNVTLTETWRSQLAGEYPTMPLGQAWTLCYEEQFYWVTGLLIAVAPKRFFTAVAVVSVATIPFYGNQHVWSFFFDGHWLMFAAGVLVYHAANYQRRRQVFATYLILIGGIEFAAREVVRQGTIPTNDLNAALLVALLFAVVLLATKSWDARICGHWAVRPFDALGTMCYSLYLFHWPIVWIISKLLWQAGVTSGIATVLVTIPVCTVAAVAVSRLAYLGVERYCLNAPQRPAAAGSIAAPAAVMEKSGFAAQ